MPARSGSRPATRQPPGSPNPGSGGDPVVSPGSSQATRPSRIAWQTGRSRSSGKRCQRVAAGPGTPCVARTETAPFYVHTSSRSSRGGLRPRHARCPWPGGDALAALPARSGSSGLPGDPGGPGGWLEPGETTGSPPDPGLGLPGGWRVAGLLPLLAGIEPLGILALTWADDLPPAVRRQSELVATGVAGAMARVLREGVALPDGHRRGIGDGPTQPPPPEGTTATGHAGAADPTLAVLDVLLHPMLVCRPVRDEEGGVGDLRVEHANPATRDPAGGGPTSSSAGGSWTSIRAPPRTACWPRAAGCCARVSPRTYPAIPGRSPCAGARSWRRPPAHHALP